MSLAYITGGTTGDRIKDAFAKTNTVIGNTIVSATTSGSTLSLTKFDGNVLTTSLPESDMLVSSAITGSIIYVDPLNVNSTDDRTSLSKYNFVKPFATIEAAISAATSGDTVALLSDCEVGDNGVDTVNNIFKNGITITDLDLGVTVSYNGAMSGSIISCITVPQVDFRVLGNISFVNNSIRTISATTAVNIGCFNFFGGTYRRIIIIVNDIITNYYGFSSQSFNRFNSDATYFLKFNRIINQALSVGQKPLGMTTNGLLLNGANNLENPMIIIGNSVININGIAGTTTGNVRESCVGISGLNNALISINEIYSNSKLQTAFGVTAIVNLKIYVNKITTTDGINLAGVGNSFNLSETCRNNYIYIKNIVNSGSAFSAVLLSNLLGLNSLSEDSRDNTYFKFDKIENQTTAAALTTRIFGRFTEVIGYELLNTGGGVALRLVPVFNNNTISSIGTYSNVSVDRIIGSSVTEGAIQYDNGYFVNFSNYPFHYIHRFKNNVYIENTAPNGHGISSKAVFSTESIFNFLGNVTIKLNDSGTGFPIKNTLSNNDINESIILYKGIKSNVDYQYISGTSQTLTLNINNNLFSPNDGSSGATTTGETTYFEFEFNNGSGRKTFRINPTGVTDIAAFSFPSGTTRLAVLESMVSDLNDLFDDGGVSGYTYAGIINNVHFYYDGSYNLAARNSDLTNKGNGFYLSNINGNGLYINQGFSGSGKVKPDGIISNLLNNNLNLFVVNSDIADII